MNTVHGSTYCFRLCPWLWSSVLQGRLHSRFPVASISSRSNIRFVQHVDMVVLCSDRNSTRSSELSRCSTSRLECHSCLPPLNINQSRTIQSWSSSTKPMTPSKNIFILKVYFTTCLLAYLLTYLLTAKRSGSRRAVLTGNGNRSPVKSGRQLG